MEFHSPRILIVDDETVLRNLIKQYLEKFGYFCVTAPDVRRALIAINSDRFDLVITDIRMPEFDGTFLLKEIAQSHPDVAVIMMTAVDDTKQAVECLKLGAYDYILKPFEMEALRLSVERALERRNLLRERQLYRSQLEKKVHERTIELVRAFDEIERTYQQTLEALVSALDMRESSTAGHSKRAVEYTRILAREMGIRGNQLVQITRGALLHDVGKIGISDTILLKPAPLSEEEWKIMRQHPIMGYQMLRDIEFLRPSLDVVLYHHERYDGSGYPFGLKGEEIPIGARIFAVVDAFDAMTSKRLYREPMDFQEAVEVLKKQAGAQFDPKIVEVFLNIPLTRLKRIYQISLISYTTKEEPDYPHLIHQQKEGEEGRPNEEDLKERTGT
jgi:response regulator RpfG family c-di-GMP phosphodiesterase